MIKSQSQQFAGKFSCLGYIKISSILVAKVPILLVVYHSCWFHSPELPRFADRNTLKPTFIKSISASRLKCQLTPSITECWFLGDALGMKFCASLRLQPPQVGTYIMYLYNYIYIYYTYNIIIIYDIIWIISNIIAYHSYVATSRNCIPKFMFSPRLLGIPCRLLLPLYLWGCPSPKAKFLTQCHEATIWGWFMVIMVYDGLCHP